MSVETLALHHHVAPTSAGEAVRTTLNYHLAGTRLTVAGLLWYGAVFGAIAFGAGWAWKKIKEQWQ